VIGFGAFWSSNNKYSLLFALIIGAQIVRYELSAGTKEEGKKREGKKKKRGGGEDSKGHIPA